MNGKILITDEVHLVLVEGLEAKGFRVNYQPKITPEQVLAAIPDYEGLIVNSKVYVGKEILDKAVKLKFVCRAGSGLEIIDTDYAKLKNIVAMNAPEGNRVAVAP